VVAYGVCRWLPEPARGGASRLAAGATHVVGAEHDRASAGRGVPDGATATEDEFDESEAQLEVEAAGVRPREELVLREDPERMTLWTATRYVLKVPTNRILIVASGLGYFYFQGIETFGIVFLAGRYGMSHVTATLALVGIGLAAVVGVIAGGAMADRRLHAGDVTGRITIGGLSFVVGALLFLPGLLIPSTGVALACFVLAGVAFGARNAPLDAARLDVMHHRLWGRAEGVRTVVRRLLSAGAPVTFGVMADHLATGGAIQGAQGFGATASAEGLHLTFLILLVTLLAGGALTFRARPTYELDVATAVASETETRAPGRGRG
jgi:sugar phosphate permease